MKSIGFLIFTRKIQKEPKHFIFDNIETVKFSGKMAFVELEKIGPVSEINLS